MKLELHPDAVKNFNEKADSLLSELAPIPSKSFNINNKDSFRPNFPISGNFGEKDDQIVVKFKDVFKHKDQLISLKESSKKIEQLSRNMQRTALYERVSVALLTDLIKEWIEAKYKNITNLSMVDYLVRAK